MTATATRASLAPPRETAEGWRGLEAFLAYLGTRGSPFEPPRPAQAGCRLSSLTSKNVAQHRPRVITSLARTGRAFRE